MYAPILLLCFLNVVCSSRLLFIPMQQRSHVLDQLGAAVALLSRGHEVYMALGSTYPAPEVLERDTGVHIISYSVPDNGITFFTEEFERFIAHNVFVSHDKFAEFDMEAKLIHQDCTYMMEDERFISHVKALKFDLAVADGFGLCPCTQILPHNLSIPYISFAVVFHPWHVRSPALPSFIPIPGPLKVSYPMNFWDRIKSLICHVIAYNVLQLLPAARNRTLLDTYTQGPVADWDELTKKSLLFVWEHDHHLDFPTPILPNTILIPGLTTAPAKLIEGELGRILDTAGGRNGIVLVSFGSTAHYMPVEIVTKFLQAFDGLPWIFIVKFAIPEGASVPENVIVRSWLPQNDILGHSKTKLFITHCGNNGQYEALYHAVPMIGMPFFAEQDHNCFRAAVKGFSLEMSVHDFTADQLRRNIIEVIENPKYRDIIRKASQIWHEEPMTPRQKVTFWVEHVLKYGGGHLRSYAMDMSLLEFWMIDIICFLAAAVIVGFFVSKWILNWAATRFR